MTVTLISEDVREIDATVADGRLLVDPAVLGWELKPEGLCRDDVCVPLRTMPATGAGVDLQAMGAALGRPVEVDLALGAAAIALPAEERRRALDSLQAPPFTLPDLDGAQHRLEEWRGRKKLLVAFSSW